MRRRVLTPRSDVKSSDLTRGEEGVGASMCSERANMKIVEAKPREMKGAYLGDADFDPVNEHRTRAEENCCAFDVSDCLSRVEDGAAKRIDVEQRRLYRQGRCRWRRGEEICLPWMRRSRDQSANGMRRRRYESF